MKKVLKILLYGLAVLVVGAIIVSYIAYSSFSPSLKGIEPNESDLAYFLDSYDDCRDAFLLKAGEMTAGFENAELFRIEVPGSTDNDLSVDLFYIPPHTDTSRLIIMSSAIHGVEGFTGSAVQRMAMTELIEPGSNTDMGFLFIHAMNPYGFKYGRRVTENNVDLNRNCSIDGTLYSTENQGYADLYDFVNPSGVVKRGSLFNQFFYMVAIAKIVKASMPVLRQAVLQGQYQFPDGLYFGGKVPEPQIESIASLLAPILKDYEYILEIDLHTGYGEIGKLHLFPNPIEDQKVRQLTGDLFAGYHIDWGDSDDFYTVNGDFCSFLGSLNPDATFLSMPFEFGTLNSQVTFGSITSLQNMILENQKQENKIKETSLRMYYPEEEEWRSVVISQSRDVLASSIEAFQKLSD